MIGPPPKVVLGEAGADNPVCALGSDDGAEGEEFCGGAMPPSVGDCKAGAEEGAEDAATAAEFGS